MASVVHKADRCLGELGFSSDTMAAPGRPSLTIWNLALRKILAKLGVDVTTVQ